MGTLQGAVDHPGLCYATLWAVFFFLQLCAPLCLSCSRFPTDRRFSHFYRPKGELCANPLSLFFFKCSSQRCLIFGRFFFFLTDANMRSPHNVVCPCLPHRSPINDTGCLIGQTIYLADIISVGKKKIGLLKIYLFIFGWIFDDLFILFSCQFFSIV